MTKKKAIILLSAIAVIIAYIMMSSIYLKNANFYGQIIIESDNPNFLISGISPNGNQLSFNAIKKNNQNLGFDYFHNRFYKSIYIESNDSISVNCIKSITINGEKRNFRLVQINSQIKKNNYEIVPDLNYSIFNKHLDFASFLILKTYKIIIGLLCIILIYIAIRFRKKLYWFLDKLSLTAHINTKKERYLFALFITLICVFISIIYLSNNTDKSVSKFDNEINLEEGRDQYDYHTIAVNFAEKNIFLVNGQIVNEIDYKISRGNDPDKVYNIELLTGLKTYNRFPGYPFLISFIYRIFGPNPIFVKIWQIILLLTISFFLPLIGFKIWNKNGFLAGIFSAPLVFVYLLPYSMLVLPDTFTVFINFFILWFYISSRQNFTRKNIIIFALILGLSFLVKTSLVLILPIIAIDFIIIAFKSGIKKHYPKLIVFASVFLICWVPYNIWSVVSYNTHVKTCNKILSEIQNTNTNLKELNSIKNPGTDNYIFENINQSDILKFKKEIEPFINTTYYLPYNFASKKYNKNIITLSYCKIISLNDKPYFMISLISNYGGLECHNEYVSENGITNLWLNDKNSFYNNDKMHDKSFGLRIINFYLHNPKQFFKIAHSKLSVTQNQTYIFTLFTILLLAAILIISINNLKKGLKQKIIFIITTLVLVLAIIFNQYIIYFYISTLLSMLFVKEFENKALLPLLLIQLNGILFILLSYCSARYLTYYLVPAYLIAAYLLVFVINSFKSYFAILNKITTSNDKN